MNCNSLPEMPFDLDVLLIQMVQLALELGRQGVSLQRRSLKAEGY